MSVILANAQLTVQRQLKKANTDLRILWVNERWLSGCCDAVLTGGIRRCWLCYSAHDTNVHLQRWHKRQCTSLSLIWLHSDHSRHVQQNRSSLCSTYIINTYNTYIIAYIIDLAKLTELLDIVRCEPKQCVLNVAEVMASIVLLIVW